MCLSMNASERPNEAALLKGNRAQMHNVREKKMTTKTQKYRQHSNSHIVQ